MIGHRFQKKSLITGRRFFLISILLLGHTLTFSQTVEIINFDHLEERWSEHDDTLYVINYWATWCLPCIEELPDFMDLDRKMKGEKFKMILVSLDFPSHANSRVVPFIQKKSIETEVVILDDDPNVWIDKVDINWDGAIPVTQFIKNQRKEFHSGQLGTDQLQEIVKKHLQTNNNQR